MSERAVILGTRGSPLALAQARRAARRLARAHPGLRIRIAPIRTAGDKARDRRLADIGGKGLFTREIDAALLDGRIDLAVHSLKDVPSALPDGLALDCFPEREDPRDAWIARAGGGPRALPRGAAVGASSPRRAAQLLRLRPDLRIAPLRGNVGTRLARVAAGAIDATLLAVAGLRRLGRAGAIGEMLDTRTMLPAVGQGTIAIARRRGDAAMRSLLAPLDDPDAAAASRAERAMLARLGGSCRSPIAGLAVAAPGGRIAFTGLVARPDGSVVIVLSDSAPAAEAAALGDALGARLAERAGPGFFDGRASGERRNDRVTG